MDIFHVLSMLGGLALFLYGMHVMGDSLARMSGGKLERVLEKLTSNRLMAVLLGAGVTAVIQSSGATTVMVVGFVNSGIMKLNQAIGIIMGANIGTTATSWLLSLAGIEGGNFFLQMLKPTSFSPVLAFIGVIFLVFCKGEKKHNIGSILIGFAVLMYGMNAMSDAVKPLSDVPEFTSVLTKFSNPILGLIAGFVLTTVMQSSSVSVGILQALCATGAVNYAMCVPIIMGQYIGSCTTAMLSSVGASKEAKRAAAVHFYFNVIGTLIFLILFYGSDAFIHYKFLELAATPAGIATVHSVFNVFATVVLLPMSGLLEFLAVKTIRDKESDIDKNTDAMLQLLDPLFLEKPGFAIMQSKEVAIEMCRMTNASVEDVISLIGNYNEEGGQHVRDVESVIDRYEDELGTYLLRLSAKDLSKEDGHTLSTLLHCIGDIERISDLAVNILLSVEEMNNKELSFSKKAMEELSIYSNALKDILSLTLSALESNDRDKAELVQPLESVIDDMNKELKRRHVKRLRKGKCTIELGLNLSEITDTFERISDHCSNIAVCLIQVEEDDMETHGYRRELKSNDAQWYLSRKQEFATKYLLP